MAGCAGFADDFFAVFLAEGAFAGAGFAGAFFADLLATGALTGDFFATFAEGVFATFFFAAFFTELDFFAVATAHMMPAPRRASQT